MAFNTTSIPKLPGMNVDLPTMGSRNRPQTLVYKNGFSFPREDMSLLQTAPGGPLLASTKSDATWIGGTGLGGFGNTMPRADQPGASTTAGTVQMNETAGQPAWVAFDGKVLRFHGYFKESVTDSATENQRIRKCVIYYYLADDSLYVSEPKASNSGLPQGVFLKKHKVPKDGGPGFVSWRDLAVGEMLSLYGRNFFITGADAFTRSFYSANGRELAPEEEVPAGMHETMIATMKTFKKTLGPPRARTDAMARFTEAKLGKASNALTEKETLGQFLANDGKVLRFFCVWDTRGKVPNGERREYVLNYFLADDTVEVLETKDASGGRDPWSRMLKRCKLPSIKLAFDATGPTKTFPTYMWNDIRVGGTIPVFGREFLVYDADDFTKAWCAEQGVDQSNTVDVTEVKPPRPVAALPPYNGYGLLADSEQNCRSLLPKPPRADFNKLMDNDKKVLRFRARLVQGPDTPSPTSADLSRWFIVSYFLADDTLSVYEPTLRNTGFPGGIFLARSVVTKNAHPDGERYASSDFYVGNTIRVYNRLFLLAEADGYTVAYLDGDLDSVVSDVRKRMDGETLRSLLDAAGASVSVADLSEILSAAGAPVSTQQLMTLTRKWAVEGEVTAITSADLMAMLA